MKRTFQRTCPENGQSKASATALKTALAAHANFQDQGWSLGDACSSIMPSFDRRTAAAESTSLFGHYHSGSLQASNLAATVCWGMPVRRASSAPDPARSRRAPAGCAVVVDRGRDRECAAVGRSGRSASRRDEYSSNVTLPASGSIHAPRSTSVRHMSAQHEVARWPILEARSEAVGALNSSFREGSG